MSAAVSLPRSLQNIAPFRRSPERRDAVAATVRGQIPAWLRGEVVRTCPAVFERGAWRAEHWFDGLGMLYAFRIGDDVVDFRSRLLESEAARDASAGKSTLGTFGTRRVLPLWRRILQPVPRVTDNANVNIVKMGDELVAMTEADRQLVVDPSTLAALGSVAYEDDGLRGAILSAHPHFDFETKRVVNVATKIGSGGTLSIYEHAASSRQRTIVGSWKTNRIPYVHSFGLTPKSAVLVAHPFSVNPIKMLWSSKGYIDHFDWSPSEGTRLVVVDRASGAVREHVADPFFVFHTVNAFEKDGATVLDLLAYGSPEIVGALRIERMIERLPDLRPSLVRITMRPGQERASVETLSDHGFEFPSTNYKRVNGQPYRYVWGAADGPRATGAFASEIVKLDPETSEIRSYSDDEHVFGEPIFVARPGAVDEDDGVLVTVGSAKTEDTSILAVIDAMTMSLVASAEVPSAIPLGFHGSFVRG